jgi:ComF family protein
MEGGFLLQLKKLWNKILELLIPPACLVCGNRIDDRHQVICSDCEAKLYLIGEGTCPVCGSENKKLPCEFCAEGQFNFDSAISIFRYSGPVRDLIHILKYEGYSSPAGYFALPIAELIESHTALKNYDYICSVPLHRVRKRERGYNQSDLIAYAVAQLIDMLYLNPVQRRINTLSQTLLSRDHRIKNLEGAFKVKDKKLVEGKKIILIDDVFTTGSTLNEIAKTLHSAGAEKICAITVARA